MPETASQAQTSTAILMSESPSEDAIGETKLRAFLNAFARHFGRWLEFAGHRICRFDYALKLAYGARSHRRYCRPDCCRIASL
ncbi:hypothetical protein BI364_10345 [Acidihalobacter yilgarnensis]|uniref:Uncharacterized protein n=1 Tax=Acidihalobacter yilgarnensis TaxID=2819280 RepID=A0A1D8IPB1_9GAMM|nr:hypothetical protein BI364_10345 [Acidihalobacter yilgarnensis]